MIEKQYQINTKKELKDWINYEQSKYFSGKRSFLHKFICCNEIDLLIKHIKLLRKTEYLFNSGHAILYRFFNFRLNQFQNKYCIHVPCFTCGKGLKIMHVGPVLINKRAKVYNDVSIHIGVSIVAQGRTDEAPIIMDGCVIGVNSTILGGVAISKNVVVGANSLVNKNVLEEDIAVAGCPAKKISNNGRTAWEEGTR